MSQTTAAYVCGYLIHFSDGGEPEERVLHRAPSRSASASER